ncbi:hypothetical protein V4C53_42960 [Paraburkholderia azotifigens]
MKLISAVDDNDDLIRQLESALVKKIDDYGSLEFDVSDTVAYAYAYANVSGPLVTGQQEDIDTIATSGPYINFILLLKAGLISELDIYKDDGAKAVATYDPEKFFLSQGLPPNG